ncbi:ammonium transporter [Rhodopirellula bahusiensis]|uniref:histidine kinase n=2 Tax=Rhodopirellula bahusiensis TaxID=2014065 RepID=A0A2G1W5M2_9BACT|nr:ammonium transporter [Rhodopirellula bahusiensis]
MAFELDSRLLLSYPLGDATQDMGHQPDWLLLCAVIVLLMQAGFMCVESGLVREKNSISVAVKNLADLLVSVASFWVIGFSIMFGSTVLGLFGVGLWLPDFASSDSLAAFFVFQAVFCGTATTIVSGAVAERMRFHGYLISCVCISALIYPIVGHWVWASGINGMSAGWLEALGFRDFAGSTVVHSVGGWAALASCIVIGPRMGRFQKSGPPREIQPSNLTLAYLGAFILFFGWFGFNCGSTFKASSEIAPVAVNTLLGACFGGLAAMLLSSFREGVPDPRSIINGLLGGLVGITASGSMIDPKSAALIGAVSGVVVLLADLLLIRLKVDDAVGAIAVHGFCGAWGTIALALFIRADELAPGLSRWDFLAVQAFGVLATFGFVFVGTYLLLRTVGVFYQLRVDPETERLGLNVAEHKASSRLLDLAVSMDAASRMRKLDPSCKVQPEYGTAIGDLVDSYNKMVDHICDDQSALAEATERAESLTAILDDSPNEIVIVHADSGQVFSLNRGARTNLQWDEDEFSELTFDSIFETEFGELKQFRLSAFDDQTGFTQQSATAVRKDGSTYPASISVQHAEFLGNEVLVVLAVDMTSQADLKERLHAAEKMEAVGQLAAGIAHEINTPLQCMSGNIEFLQDFQENVQKTLQLLAENKSDDAEIQEITNKLNSDRWKRLLGESDAAIADTQESISRVVQIVGAMRVLSHPGQSGKANTSVNEVLRNSVAISRGRWKYAAEMELELCEAEPNIDCHANELSQVFCNLFVNAADAIGEKSEVSSSSELGRISVTSSLKDDGVLITVGDTGNGMPESVRRRCFDQFYTTKPVGKGTGQGLSIAYQIIVKRHGGTIDIASEDGVGTEFQIWVPTDDSDKAVERTAKSSKMPREQAVGVTAV